MSDTTTKHTPGPWNISPLSQPNADGTIYIDSGLVQIVDVLRRPDSTTTWANARLIAAAPDMLEALRAVNEWLMEGWDDEDVAMQSVNPLFRQALTKARAAIKAAEGE